MVIHKSKKCKGHCPECGQRVLNFEHPRDVSSPDYANHVSRATVCGNCECQFAEHYSDKQYVETSWLADDRDEQRSHNATTMKGA